MKTAIVSFLTKKLDISKADVESLLEVPKEKERGDYAFPCFSLAARLKKNPVAIAQDIARSPIPKEIERVHAVGPYVNFFINPATFALSTLTRVLKEKENYGSSKTSSPKTFMIEFSQPNTHKAFHIGHIRGTSFGESIARIRAFSGYKVVRANYSGDTGMHIAKWLWAYTHFHKGKSLQKDESWFAKIYVEAVHKLEGNEKGEAEVAEINRKLDARTDPKLLALWKETRKLSIAAWKPIYADLGVTFNTHFFESEVESAGKKIAQSLVSRGLARISDGATIMDLENEGLGVWVLLRGDGTVLYSAKDLALAEEKYKTYKLDESLIVTSVEQNLHFQQLKKTLELMKFKRWKQYDHLGYESVRLPEGKMSSRTGNNIIYSEFKEELVSAAKEAIRTRAKLSSSELERRALAIAVAAMKYAMLKQDIHKVIVFQKEDALRFEGDTGPYLLYGYARAQSILEKSLSTKKKISVPILSESERLLLNAIQRFPDVVRDASEHHTPAKIAHYAYALTKEFNEFYHATKVIGSEEESFRLMLVRAFAQTLKNALHLLGINTLDKM